MIGIYILAISFGLLFVSGEILFGYVTWTDIKRAHATNSDSVFFELRNDFLRRNSRFIRILMICMVVGIIGMFVGGITALVFRMFQ